MMLCTSYSGEGNGNPLQYSCLENPTDREAWWATVHGVTKVRYNLVTKAPPPPVTAYRQARPIILTDLRSWISTLHTVLPLRRKKNLLFLVLSLHFTKYILKSNPLIQLLKKRTIIGYLSNSVALEEESLCITWAYLENWVVRYDFLQRSFSSYNSSNIYKIKHYKQL